MIWDRNLRGEWTLASRDLDCYSGLNLDLMGFNQDEGFFII